MPIQLDAKLNAFRRSSRGFFVTLEIGPDCDWSDLAAAPLGSAFVVVMEPYDPETGKRIEASPGNASPRDDAGQQRGEAGKPRRPFDTLPLSQQAALLCNDSRFRLWWAPNSAPTIPQMADSLREHLGVESRAALDDPDNRLARDRFRQLLGAYRQDTGQFAEQRG